MVNIAFICHCDKKHGKMIINEPIDKINIEYIDPYTGCKYMDDLENNSMDIFYSINCPLYYPFFDSKFNKALYPKSYKELIEEHKEDMKWMKEGIPEEGILPLNDPRDKEIMDTIFKEGNLKLKEGGKIVIPLRSIHYSNNEIKNFVAYVKDKYPNFEFISSIENNVPIEYIIDWDYEFTKGGDDDRPEEGLEKQNSKFNNDTTKFLIFTKINSRSIFLNKIKTLGKDAVLSRFLSRQILKSRIINSIELELLITKIMRVYPKVTRDDILNLFTKN